MKTNFSNTLGIRSPIPKNKSRGIYRAFAEMDLHQVKQIKNIISQKGNYSKTDVGQIEMEVIISLFGDETFFSLFAEQAQLFDIVSN